MTSNKTKSKIPGRRRNPRPLPDNDIGCEQSDDAQPQANEKPKLKSSDVKSLKYFSMLAPLLERLHDDNCKRDKAKQRDLHYDQYCMLILLYLFNPTITSLRAIEQASQLSKVQKKLGCSPASLGSLSEASRIFDAERLKEIIGELGAQSQSFGLCEVFTAHKVAASTKARQPDQAVTAF